LKKLFAGIYKVDFDKNHTQITSMISSANEYVPLKKQIRITDDVEIWLGELEREMRDTLDSLLKKTL
jgi:dynein heavy chain 2